MNNNIQERFSLYSIVTLIVVILMSAFIVIGVSFNYLSIKKKLEDNLKSDLETIILRAQNSLPYLIDGYAVNEYEKLIESEMTSLEIVAMVVEDKHIIKLFKKKELFSGKVRDKNWNLVDYDKKSHDAYIQNNSFVFKEAKLYNEQDAHIGTVKVYLTNKFIIKELEELVKTSFIIIGIMGLIALIILFVVLRKYVLDPIDNIVKNILIANEDGIPLNELSLKGSKELHILSASINNMIYSIKNSNQQLAQERAFLEKLIDSAPIRVFWKDKDGVYLGANKLFIQDAKLNSVDEIIGKTDFELPWANHEAKIYVADDKAVMESKESKIGILETQTNEDDELIHLNTSKVPLFDEAGKVSGVLGIYEDITQKIQDQDKIKAQEMQMIQQNRLAQLGEMISMIAHQWRQPLSVISTIMGTLQLKLMKNDVEKELLVDNFKKVSIQTKYLSDTIDDFRNFFKPDKNKSTITSTKLVSDTLNIISPALEKDKIKVISNFCCEKELYTYKNEVRQVLLNIIKNASDALVENNIENPYIKIEAHCSANTRCEIVIEDNGGGISEAIIEKIFDPYFSTKDKNGTGLGLYMSRMIIEDHCDGELSVLSEDNKTRFIIRL